MLNKSGLSNKALLHLALIVILGLLAYSNTFNVPFTFDDEGNILSNPLVKDLRYIFDPSLVKEIAPEYDFLKHDLFRSRIVAYFTFALNWRAHGLDVRGYHAVNLAIHIINALIVYWFVLVTLRTPRMVGSIFENNKYQISLLVALAFVSHPIQTQAVTYIVQRFASLATLFYLFSLTAYARVRISDGFISRKALYAMSLIAAIFAMKTKEIAFTLPLVIAFYDVIFIRDALKRRLFYLLPFFFTLLAIPMSFLGSASQSGYLDSSLKLGTDISRSAYLFTSIRVIVTYIRLILLPINQNLDYDYPIYESFFTSQVLLSFLFLASMMGLAIFLLCRSSKMEPALRLLSFGILWFFMALSVESSIIPIADVIFEHRLYLPMAGAVIAAVTAAGYLLKGIACINLNKMVSVGVAAIILIFAAATYNRNVVWRSELSLWEDVVNKSPGKWRGHYNLGNTYKKAGYSGKALEQYRATLNLKSDHSMAYNNIGNIYMADGRYDKAIEYYQQAIKFEPDYEDAYYNMGIAYYSKEDYDNAIENYRIALRLNPDDADVHNNLGVAYFKRGQIELARSELEAALELDPSLQEARKLILEMSLFD